MRVTGLALGLLYLFTSSACSPAMLDRVAIDRVVRETLTQPDLSKACASGESLTHALAAGAPEKRPPLRALMFSESTAGMCSELRSREDVLESLRTLKNVTTLGPERTAAVKDARYRADRLRAEAAVRFERSWTHLEAFYGPLGGDTCPRIKEKDEVVMVIGLVAGVLALIHDKGSGSTLGVPLDRINVVGRAATCLDDETWWYAPSALQAAAWAMVPGTGPENVDPWVLLEQAATKGDLTGVRFARGLQVQIAANSGRQDVLASGIRAHARSLKEMNAPDRWMLLDEYARLVSLYESDLLWTEAEGHRTPVFGELPGDAAAQAMPDIFGGDPFGVDPFGNSTDETESQETP